VPIVVALIGIYFTAQQKERQQAIETRRAENALEVENQRAQDEALQAYLDKMGHLILNEDLRNSPVDSQVRDVARARTLTVLEGLSPDRKARVIQFLEEASLIVTDKNSLIKTDATPNEAVVSLLGANLEDANLIDAFLPDADLTEVDLRHATLSDAHLNNAIMFRADLREADLRGASLDQALLTSADLQGTNLRNAFLGNANLVKANLSSADLSNAKLWAADLGGANLADASLREADLTRGVLLLDANLSRADLTGAKLTGANLTGANLKGSIVKVEQLATSGSLEGATMPNGQKYKDWLKSKVQSGRIRTAAPRSGSE